MNTTKKTNSRSLMNDSNNICVLDKNEMKEIAGKGLAVQYYVENGKIKERYIYIR